jgi:hypothetical protein
VPDKSPLSQIRDLLTELDAPELAKVGALVQLRLSCRPVEPRDDWLLEGIYAELRGRGLFSTGRLTQEQLRKIAPNYMQDVAKLREHFAPVLDGLSDVRLSAFWRVAANALAEYLLYTGPIGPRRLLSSVHRIPEAFEAAFPGYLASGLVHMVLPHG